ncbi:MAG: hypothetical protein EHM79_00230 [Geobacter sp.]|nr:MAG: hypothetical protein EHM79_00230 [Geobacter sp.]
MKPRPRYYNGRSYKISIDNHSCIAVINSESAVIKEVFLFGPKHNQDLFECIGRLISICLRNNLPLDLVIKQLRGIGGAHFTYDQDFKGGTLVRSFPDAIANFLEEENAFITSKHGGNLSEGARTPERNGGIPSTLPAGTVACKIQCGSTKEEPPQTSPDKSVCKTDRETHPSGSKQI